MTSVPAASTPIQPSLPGTVRLGRTPRKKAPSNGLRHALAKNVLAHRTKAGLSQRELAERAALTQRHISMIENGRGNPTVDTINAIAHALGVAAQALTKG